jgi:hypothetical protein
MSAAVATPTITVTDNTQKIEHVYGKLAIGASPLTYTTGGIACSFVGFDAIKASSAPISVDVSSQPAPGSAAAAKYIYQFLPGTGQGSGVLQIFTGAAAQSGLTELTGGGAIPAGVSGDTIAFHARFNRV